MDEFKTFDEILGEVKRGKHKKGRKGQNLRNTFF